MRIYTSEKFTFSHCSKYDSDNVFVSQCMCVCVCVFQCLLLRVT